MTEKEILKQIENDKNVGEFYGITEEAVQGLLDLYNRQKEEIEYYKDELEKESSIWTKIEKGNDYISKDKIRKIIKTLDNQNYNNYDLSVALSQSLKILLKE